MSENRGGGHRIGSKKPHEQRPVYHLLDNRTRSSRKAAPMTPIPADDPLRNGLNWRCPRHDANLNGSCDICTRIAFRIARAALQQPTHPEPDHERTVDGYGRVICCLAHAALRAADQRYPISTTEEQMVQRGFLHSKDTVSNEFIPHGFTCGFCSWGRGLERPATEFEYQNHMMHVHPDEFVAGLR